MLVEIPVTAIPNQIITTVVNSQQITLNIYQRGQNLFTDIYMGNIKIIAGMKCNNAVYLNQYPTFPRFNGYLFFYTISGEEPTYLTLGADAHLFYSDFDALALDYVNWLAANGGT